MTNFRPLIVTLLLVGLVILSVLTGGIMLAANNGASQSIMDDPSMSAYLSSLNDSLDDSYDESQPLDTAFSDSPITPTTGAVYVESVGGIWQTMRNNPTTIFSISLAFVRDKVLGGPYGSIILNTALAIFGLLIIFGAYKWIYTGESG